jgi:hypothetical protein
MPTTPPATMTAAASDDVNFEMSLIYSPCEVIAFFGQL